MYIGIDVSCFLLIIFSAQAFEVIDPPDWDKRPKHSKIEVGVLISEAWKIDFQDYKNLYPALQIGEQEKYDKIWRELTNDIGEKLTAAESKGKNVYNCTLKARRRASEIYSDACAKNKECVLLIKNNIQTNVFDHLKITHLEHCCQNNTAPMFASNSREMCRRDIASFLKRIEKEIQSELTKCFGNVQKELKEWVADAKLYADMCIERI